MREWLAELAGEQYVDAILWTAAALVALVVLLGLVKLFRNLNSGTYVAGGRNRKTRLAVMDAAAVDGQRRLVLVRRDDVEHLLLIGGPTDVVVEQDIRLTAQRRAAPVEAARPAAEAEEVEPQLPPAPRMPQQPRAPELSPPHVGRPTPPLPERPVRSAPPPVRQPPERPALSEPRVSAPLRTPAPAPRVGTQPPPAVRPSPRPTLTNGAERRDGPDSIDETLMNELDLTGDELTGNAASAESRSKSEASLDDEMARLLGELANPRR